MTQRATLSRYMDPRAAELAQAIARNAELRKEATGAARRMLPALAFGEAATFPLPDHPTSRHEVQRAVAKQAAHLLGKGCYRIASGIDAATVTRLAPKGGA